MANADAITDRRRHEHAACRGIRPSLWLDPANRMERALALAVCEVCEVRAQCLAEALGEVWTKGVWGGTLESERNTAAKRRALRQERQGTLLRCAGNLTLQCSRHHHLLHTPGWHAKLLPDATLVVTAPNGRTLDSQPPERPPPRPPRE